MKSVLQYRTAVRRESEGISRAREEAFFRITLAVCGGFSLVPKLCLGTHFRETPFRLLGPLAKQSFENRRSQTEFGNEAGSRCTRLKTYRFS
jgi:hypothetical protein